MKLKKLFALALCAATVAGLLAVTATPASAADIDNGLILNKEVTPVKDQDGTYQVTLEAYSTGSAIYAPAEIVLVLDESSGMATKTTKYDPVYMDDEDAEGDYYIKQGDTYVPVNYCSDPHFASGSSLFSGDGWYTGSHFWTYFHWGYRYRPMRNENDTGSGYYPNPVQFYKGSEVTTSKMTALQTAAKSFVASVNEQARAKNADYKVSVIGYKDDATTTEGANPIKIGLTSVNTNANVELVNAAIDSLSTATTAGVDMATALGLANSQLSTVTDGDHQKVVVVFSCMENIGETAANSAIVAAKALKDNRVKVFTVGMTTLADPTLDVADGQIDWEQPIALVNARMQGVSSNFPNATACRTLGTKDADTYYKTAANQEQISSILTAIQSQLTSTKSTLNASAVIKDTVTEYFEISSDVTVSTYNCTSFSYNKDTDTITAAWADSPATTNTGSDYISGNTVAVSGFDFSSYFVTANAKDGNTVAPHGRKVVVTFTIKAKADFLGGNGVPTNVDTSGVYVNATAATPYEVFTVPTVNVPVKTITPDVLPQTIYLSNSINTSALYNEVAFTGENAWKDDFVTITYTVNDAAPTDVAPTNCTDYTVTCTVNGGGTNTASSTQTATVHVLKPTVTGTDAHIKMGAEAPMGASHQWNTTCGCEGTIPAVTGDIPAVTYEYNKTEDNQYPETCTDYTVFAVVAGTKVESIRDDFTVHVHAPALTGSASTVRLGSSTLLDTNDVTLTWQSTCIEGKAGTYEDSTLAASYSFNGTANSLTVTPAGCTDYTAKLTQIGGVDLSQKEYTAMLPVHVQTPVVTGTDQTIYLGNSATLTAQVTGWNACSHSDAPTNVTGNPSPSFGYSVENPVVSPGECTDYTATLIQIGQVPLTDDTYKDKFTVHVLKPSLATTDTTIYFGTSTDLDERVTVSGWSDKTVLHSNVPAVTGNAPEPVYSFNIGSTENKDAYSPSDCTNLIATWTLAKQNFTNNFTVHVAKPSFNTTDITIYRGNSTDLNGRISVADDWSCDASGLSGIVHDKQTLNDANKPTITYAFNDGTAITTANAYAPTDCKSVVATPTVGNKTWTALGAFNVHVLQPTFTVTTQDVWADYETEVDLTQYGIKTCELVWKDETTGHTTPDPSPEGAPSVSSKTFAFTEDADGTYTVGETDATFTVPKLTFALSNGYTADFALADKSFTVHVNTFALTINKTWSGADCYKQDAIFTITRDDNETLQVVIPEEQTSVTVAGLICGKDYTITEENGWTWRWNASSAQTTTHVSHVAITTEAVKNDQSMTFTNTLDNSKIYWLDGDYWCENTFGKKKEET